MFFFLVYLDCLVSFWIWPEVFKNAHKMVLKQFQNLYRLQYFSFALRVYGKVEKCDFYVQYWMRFVLDFHLCVCFVFGCFACVVAKKYQRSEREWENKTWKSSCCQLLNKPDLGKMNWIVTLAHTQTCTHIHIHILYLFFIPFMMCAFNIHLGQK